jgi:pyrophosphatase PpaX
VLFDLDGTLIDSVPLIRDSFLHTFAAHGLPRPADHELARAMGIPLREFFASLGKAPSQVSALIGTYREHNLAHHDARVRAFPGVVETIEVLRGLDVRTAVVTSKNRGGSERGLHVVGLDRAFDVLVTCDDVTKPKPDREPVDRALAALGVPASRAIFVGDSLHDLASGRAAGVSTAAALWGPFSRAELASGQPDYWLESPADVTSLVIGSACTL